jgi:CRP-like cAMP-binding protein
MSELAGIETVVVLQSADLFSFCKAEEILRIASIAHQRRFQSGDKLYQVHDPADVLYVVVQGGVKLESPDTEPQRVGPLAAFGVVDILSGRLRSKGATAEQDTLVLAIDAEDFFDLLANNIEIVKALFRQLLHRSESKT